LTDKPANKQTEAKTSPLACGSGNEGGSRRVVGCRITSLYIAQPAL